MEEEHSPSAAVKAAPRSRLIKAAIIVALFLALATVAVPSLRWQFNESTRTRCLSNERRLATALLLYAQDHDGRLPPPQYQTSTGEWRHWVSILQPYISPEKITVCPVQKVEGAVHPQLGFPYPHSYALNERFYDVLSAGPYPIENLELPSQTAMIVESGGYRIPGRDGLGSLNIYTDTAKSPAAFPSLHEGRMNVAAADGHVVSLKIAHYNPTGHDSFYGRLGGSVYNWNGGHPNGDTGGPPRE